MTLALATLSLIWLGFITYVILGGADFGAGIWDLLATGPTAQRQHYFITRILGPVWEANHVWLIFLLIGLMSVFPTVFATFMSALFVPLTLALFGIVLRGAGFIFRAYASPRDGWTTPFWSRIFSISSLVTPFFLGTAAAAVASGKVSLTTITPLTLISSWTTPFALCVGLMAVLQCATLAALYLTAEAQRHQEQDFVKAYRLKSLVGSALTSLLGIVSIVLSHTEAPWLWQGLLSNALPFVIITICMGWLVLLTLLLKSYTLACLSVILETAFMLISWGVSQYPYIIPPTLTIEQAANAPQVVLTILIVIIIGMILVIPALLFLFKVFKWSVPPPIPNTSVPD